MTLLESAPSPTADTAPNGRVSNELDELLAQHQDLRQLVAELSQRVEELREQLGAVEALQEENDQLRTQNAALRLRLSQSRTPSRTEAAAVSQETHQHLLEEHEALLEERAALVTERAELLAQHEGARQEQERLMEANARLSSEVESWVAEASALDAQLMNDRQLRHELEELAEESMAEAGRLKEQLGAALVDVERERQRSTELEAELSTRLPHQGSQEAGHDGEILRQLGVISEAVRRPTTPAPEVLKGLYELRRALREGQDQQQTAFEVLEQRLLRAIDEHTFRPAAKVPGAAEVEPGDGADSAGDVTTVAPEPSGSAPPPAESDASPSTDTVAATVRWEEEFERVELAWLAGREVGDPHEGWHFSSVVRRVRGLLPTDGWQEALLKQLDEVRGRFGDDFSYGLLDATLGRLHRPTLNSGLLTYQMRLLHGRRNWHRH